MRFYSLNFLMLTFNLFAQPLTLRIESITSIDESDKERIFTVNYTLKNNTNDTINFYFHPKNVSPSTGGSMTKEIYYKIYENINFIEIGVAFNQVTAETAEFDFDEKMTQAEKDSIMIVYVAKKLDEDPVKLLKTYKEEGSIGLLDPNKDYMQKYYQTLENYYHTLLPNQNEEFVANFSWNKNRYYFNEPNEFYLDENAKHYFEMTLVALKEEFKDKIDAEEYDKIMKNPYFVKGVFVSNKVEIDFNNK